VSRVDVVTHGYTDGSEVNACEAHEELVPDFSATGASYSGVNSGLHAGRCDFCPEELRHTQCPRCQEAVALPPGAPFFHGCGGRS
jgi:hypothetical protein